MVDIVAELSIDSSDIACYHCCREDWGTFIISYTIALLQLATESTAACIVTTGTVCMGTSSEPFASSITLAIDLVVNDHRQEACMVAIMSAELAHDNHFYHSIRQRLDTGLSFVVIAFRQPTRPNMLTIPWCNRALIVAATAAATATTGVVDKLVSAVARVADMIIVLVRRTSKPEQHSIGYIEVADISAGLSEADYSTIASIETGTVSNLAAQAAD